MLNYDAKMRARKPLSASYSEAQLKYAHGNENFAVGLRDYQIEYINRILQSDDNAED